MALVVDVLFLWNWGDCGREKRDVSLRGWVLSLVEGKLGLG